MRERLTLTAVSASRCRDPQWDERIREHEHHRNARAEGAVLVGSDGNMYRAADAIWFGGAFNAQQGTDTSPCRAHRVRGPRGDLVGAIHITST